MANARQISVFLENKPGTLDAILELGKESGINVRALSLADTRDFGILRMIVNDTDKTLEAVKSAGYVATVTEIVAVTVPDTPGQLSRVVGILAKDGVNIEYLYAFTGSSDKSVSFVIRVDDNAHASAALVKAGIIELTENDLSRL